ncbi:uncharacterized protein LOC102079366 isoform X6 [Oreochromis niloticus]|uniref:uncharacterized protein LOC102079366 isoform X6 n=1 Tax=Oreochromis niloticus TaxID=8128 RepID=UPI000DF3B6E2|nr:uncharacterized protein LOC102079366 isoform X6 [Oreochromis niloticus]
MEQRWLPGVLGYGGPPGLRYYAPRTVINALLTAIGPPPPPVLLDKRLNLSSPALCALLPGPLLPPGSWMVCRPTLSPVSWILGARGMATSTWWIGKATGWRTGPGSLGRLSWTSACCGSSIACVRVSLVGRREAPVEGGGGYCHGPCASPADPVLGNMCFVVFLLSLSLSLTCRGGAHYGLPPLAHTPAISTPAAYLGDRKAYLRRQHCVTRRWIVELSASVTLLLDEGGRAASKRLFSQDSLAVCKGQGGGWQIQGCGTSLREREGLRQCDPRAAGPPEQTRRSCSHRQRDAEHRWSKDGCQVSSGMEGHPGCVITHQGP